MKMSCCSRARSVSVIELQVAARIDRDHRKGAAGLLLAVAAVTGHGLQRLPQHAVAHGAAQAAALAIGVGHDYVLVIPPPLDCPRV